MRISGFEPQSQSVESGTVVRARRSGGSGRTIVKRRMGKKAGADDDSAMTAERISKKAERASKARTSRVRKDPAKQDGRERKGEGRLRLVLRNPQRRQGTALSAAEMYEKIVVEAEQTQWAISEALREDYLRTSEVRRRTVDGKRKLYLVFSRKEAARRQRRGDGK